MPPILERATGRLYFRSIQTQEIVSLSEDLTQSGSIKIVQEGDNTALQVVNPDGSLGPKLVLGAKEMYMQSGNTVSGVTETGVIGGGSGGSTTSVTGIEVTPLLVSNTLLGGLHADNAVSVYQTKNSSVVPEHSLLASTTRDLILAGSGIVTGSKSIPCHVVTLGELHAYKGDGVSEEGGDAVKVFGKKLVDASTNTYETASLNIGVQHDLSYADTGDSTTRARVSSTSNADLSVESGNQLRLRGDGVVIGSHSSVKIYPNKDTFVEPGEETNNPHGYLEVAHRDGNQSSAITLSTPSVASPVDIVVKPATGKIGAEADTFEMGAGDVRYKFNIVNGQLRISKRVLSSGDPEKTVFVFDA
eukprot:jgi/Mesvir1/18622/Mv17131-RA.1